jgi:hypothetical protein
VSRQLRTVAQYLEVMSPADHARAAVLADQGRATGSARALARADAMLLAGLRELLPGVLATSPDGDRT